MKYLERNPETGRLRQPFSALLAVLVSVVLVLAFVTQFGGPLLRELVGRSLVLVAFAGAYSFSPRGRLGLTMLVLGGVFLPLGIWGVFLPSLAETLISYVLLALVFGWLTLLVLSSIVRDTSASIDTVRGAFCAFLLMGMGFGISHAAIALLVPGSYIGLAADTPNLTVNAIYFSYVTMTTLGFGDITPLEPLSRTLTYLEAILGQGFIAVIVARFVGMEVAETISRKRSE